MIDNLYDILGISKDATDEEIKAAYRAQAKKNHTDVGGDNDKMVAITKAYAILKDPDKRAHYDKTGQEKKDDFEIRFRATIQDIFMRVVETKSVNIETMDLIDIFRQNLENLLNGLEARLTNIEEDIRRINKVKKRIGGERSEGFIEVLTGNIMEKEKSINLVKVEMEFVRKCLEIVNSCHYDFEAPELYLTSQSGTQEGFTWRSF